MSRGVRRGDKIKGVVLLNTNKIHDFLIDIVFNNKKLMRKILVKNWWKSFFYGELGWNEAGDDGKRVEKRVKIAVSVGGD